MKNYISKPAALIKFMLLSVLAVSFIAACGYDDVNEEKAQAIADYYAEDSVAGSALIEAEALISYIDNGYVTPDGKKVVILDVTGTTPKTVVRGAVPAPQNNYFTESRSDGVAVIGNMVASGEKMDTSLRELGIDGNTLVVITASLPTTNNIHRVFWTFKYWGFSNKYVKVLNGANQYIATLNNGSYMETPVYRAIVPTTFSVKELPAEKIDSYRASFGEVFDSAKNGLFKENGSGSSILIPTMANSATVTNINGQVIARFANNSNAFAGRIRGATQLALDPSNLTDYSNDASLYFNADGRFKTAEEIMPLMTRYVGEGQKAEFLPADKNRRIITHCGSGQSTAPHWFVIREILGYTNAAIYDGSWNEWGNFATFYVKDTAQDFVTVTGTGAKTATNYLESNFDSNSRIYTYKEHNAKIDIPIQQLGKSSVFKNLQWDTSFYTDYLVLRTKVADDGTISSGSSLSAADNEYAGDGREINTADKNYQSGAGDTSTGGNSGGASTGGGSAPAGC